MANADSTENMASSVITSKIPSAEYLESELMEIGTAMSSLTAIFDKLMGSARPEDGCLCDGGQLIAARVGAIADKLLGQLDSIPIKSGVDEWIFPNRKGIEPSSSRKRCIVSTSNNTVY